MWPRFCRAIDREDLIDDPRFESNADRVENRKKLDAILDEELSHYLTDDIADKLDDHGVPASPVQNMADIFDNPQVKARGMHQHVEHPTVGNIELPASPMHFSTTPTDIRRPPPRLGEHTEEVLSELGYSDEILDQLARDDVI